MDGNPNSVVVMERVDSTWFPKLLCAISNELHRCACEDEGWGEVPMNHTYRVLAGDISDAANGAELADMFAKADVDVEQAVQIMVFAFVAFTTS